VKIVHRENATEKSFSVTISPEATEYLGSEIHIAKDHLCGWNGQPHLYKNLE